MALCRLINDWDATQPNRVKEDISTLATEVEIGEKPRLIGLIQVIKVRAMIVCSFGFIDF